MIIYTGIIPQPVPGLIPDNPLQPEERTQNMLKTDDNIKFNQLKIDEFHSVAICSDCIDKFLKWQQTMFAVLFPTKSAKKWSIKK